MPNTIEHLTEAGRLGGLQRGALSKRELSRLGRRAALSRWAGLTAEERKAERAKGRAERKPYPRCPCGKLTIGVAKYRGHRCEAPPAPKFESERAAQKKAAN